MPSLFTCIWTFSLTSILAFPLSSLYIRRINVIISVWAYVSFSPILFGFRHGIYVHATVRNQNLLEMLIIHSDKSIEWTFWRWNNRRTFQVLTFSLDHTSYWILSKLPNRKVAIWKITRFSSILNRWLKKMYHLVYI